MIAKAVISTTTQKGAELAEVAEPVPSQHLE